ncbi:MAG: histidinol dehydrogenase, partial [Saprospiraceae bacterium]
DLAIKTAEHQLSAQLIVAIKTAYNNIETFHAAQKLDDLKVVTMDGVECWQRAISIAAVGLYIPGGTAPLFSTVLMLGIPAKIAGCDDVILCSPPQENGEIHPATIYAAHLCGIKKIFRVGGSQAIAAMTLGTESVPKVNKLFGPGNQYVTAAKQRAQKYGVSIDLPAGPSEVLVYADDSAIPSFVASDLLSQAEHGVDSQVILVSNSEEMASKCNEEVISQTITLPRNKIVLECLENSRILIIDNSKMAFKFINDYAPEHLIIASEQPDQYIPLIKNAGSVFLGNYSPESAGDYASGTNHTLPTGGYAKSYSGTNLDAFLKKITFQKLSKQGIQNLGNTITTMAREEQLEAHARAVEIRLNSLTQKKDLG